MLLLFLAITLFGLDIPATNAKYPASGFADLPGDYCRTRQPTQCCDGRYDDCSMPIFGTLCYCDEFCDRDESPDCCPDFWNVCRGMRPPEPIIKPPCFKDGVQIPSGQSYKVNCNKCTCHQGDLQCENDDCMIDERVIQEVSLAPRQFGWTATNYSEYWGHKAREGLLLKTGTLNPEALSLKMYPILLNPDVNRIPREFDARQKPEWQGRISEVSDQGWCGSSWVFSTLGVAQDRLSIESYGNETVRLSTQDLLSCDRRGQKGCQGGHVDRAWQYLRKIGVVNAECYQYQSGIDSKVPKCKKPCPLCCVTPNMDFKRKDLYKTEPAYRISGNELDIKWEIMTNGPVQAMMKVHRDLFMYRSGVYSNSGLVGDETGSHSVRIVGWGEDPNQGTIPVPYWIVANSWGDQWGENGFFRIRRGTNESELENFIIAVRARFEERTGIFRNRLRQRRRQRTNRRRLASYYSNNFIHGNQKH